MFIELTDGKNQKVWVNVNAIVYLTRAFDLRTKLPHRDFGTTIHFNEDSTLHVKEQPEWLVTELEYLTPSKPATEDSTRTTL